MCVARQIKKTMDYRSVGSKVALLITLFILAIAPALSGQVTSEPQFPTLGGPVKIIFNASQGNRGLENFTGDVYAHTGVLTNLSTGPSNWKYVKTNWGVNTPETKLTRVSPNIYELEIADIRAYYGVPANEEILKLAFVFRSGTTPYREGKTATGGDLFVDIYEAGVFARFDAPSTSPYFPAFVDPGSSVDITGSGAAEGSVLTSLKLFVNGSLVKEETTQATIEYTISSSAAGRTDLMLVALDNTAKTDTARTYFISRPATTVANAPAGTINGINYDPSGTSVTFSMFAPGKQFAYVIGDFTNWEVKEEYQMKKQVVNGEDHFWLTVDGLTPGTEYRMQYLVDGTIRIADLFSEKILDPDFDRFINSSVYPNLLPYPVDLTQGVVTVIHPGRTPYEWQSTDYVRPPQDQLVIYELLLRDFVEESTFDVLRDTLDYLDRLGINAIELMPVSNFDGNLSWGYNPNFHGALDKSYGTRESFKRFVDEAHSRGIAVILDVVYNHTQEKSPLVQLYGTNPASNRFLGNGHAWNVFRHINHNDAYVRYWLDRMNRYWIETYRVDGYRFDLTKGFANNLNSGDNLNGYNAQRIANLKRMADQLWAYDQTAYIILEHFAANNEELELAHYRRGEGDIKGMMLWNNVTHSYSEASMGWISSSNFQHSYYWGKSGWTIPNLVSYLESHDEQWMMLKNIKFGNSSGSYNIKELNTALGRQKMIGAFFFTIPGPRMMWQFGELGYGGGPNECLKPGDGNGDCLASDPGRTGAKPIRWEYYSDPNRKALYDTWSAIINLRMDHPVFHSTSTHVTMDVGGTVKQIRLSHSTMDVTIVGNFGVTQQNPNVTFSKTGTWYDFFGETTYQVNNTTQQITLAPGQFYIFTSENTTSTSVEELPEGDQPLAYELAQNWPNPFNPTTVIRFQLPESSEVRLEVYDLLGRRVATLSDGMMQAGAHTVNFDASGLSSGVYVYRLESTSGVLTRKMTLLK